MTDTAHPSEGTTSQVSAAQPPLATCRYCGHDTINTRDRVCAVCVEQVPGSAAPKTRRKYVKRGDRD